MLLHYPALIPAHFLKYFSDYNLRPQVSCSISAMALHVGRCLGDEHARAYLADALPAIMRWTCNNHYNVRFMALNTAKKLTKRCRELYGRARRSFYYHASHAVAQRLSRYRRPQHPRDLSCGECRDTAAPAKGALRALGARRPL